MRTAPVLLVVSTLGCGVSLVRGDDTAEGGGGAASSAMATTSTTTTTTSTSTAANGETTSTGDGGGSAGGGGAGGGGDLCGGAGQPCCPESVCAGAHLVCDPVTLNCLGCAATLAGGEAAQGACVGHKGGGTSCWGANDYGQVTCEATGYSLPVSMPFLPEGFSATSVGFHSCGLVDGLVVCWGSNEFGEIVGSPGPQECVPPLVRGLLPGDAEDVQATWNGTTVALVGGAVHAWGSDATGQISGTPTGGSTLPPTLVAALSDDNVAIAAGAFATCVTKLDGTVQCLGSNEFWGLGTEDPAPVGPQVVEIEGVDEVVAGFGFFCARVEGDVLCWGDNVAGQVHLGSSDRIAFPSAVDLGGAAVRLAAGLDHACALLGDQTVVCWGANGKQQTGACEGGDVVGPTVVTLGDGQPLRAKRVVGGAVNTCAIDLNDVVVCWGVNGANESGVPYDGTLACPPVVAQIDCAASAAGAGAR